MSEDRGGRDVTFPDHSEGFLWVEPKAYTVRVECPTREAMEAVCKAVHNLYREAHPVETDLIRHRRHQGEPMAGDAELPRRVRGRHRVRRRP